MSKLKKIISIFTKGKNVFSQNEVSSPEISLPEDNNSEIEIKEEVEWYENTEAEF